MPELPEVETTVRDLRRNVLGRTFLNVWTDYTKIIKSPREWRRLRTGIKGRKIKEVRRRGKNILFDLTGGYCLLVHQKLTGHLLLGRWEEKGGRWQAVANGPLSKDPMNRYIHLITWLDNGQMLALSDLRKFAKVRFLTDKECQEEVSGFGIDPLDRTFTFKRFKESLARKKKGKIKEVLMNQEIIAGIGNIYSSEILWQAMVSPLRRVEELSGEEMRRIYEATKDILKKAISLKGESISDYRTIKGERGGFDPFRKVYRREGKKCPRCGAPIKKTVIAGRSAYYCPVCQK